MSQTGAAGRPEPGLAGDPDTGAPRRSVALAQLAAHYNLTLAGERPTLVEYARQVWAYRHFVSAFANAKLVASLDSTRLGRLWQVLTPLVNAAVYFLMFGVVLNTRNGVHNYIAYLCTGIFLYTFTQRVVLNGIRSVPDNIGLIRALRFPRACLPIATLLTQLQQLAASVAVLLVIVALSGEPITPRWVLLVPVLALQSLFNAGLGMAVARLGARLHDLKQLAPFVLRTWMYASGVFYSVAIFNAHLPRTVATALQLNPLLVYISLARDVLLQAPPLEPVAREWMYALVWALAVGVGGFVFFWRGEREYGRG